MNTWPQATKNLDRIASRGNYDTIEKMFLFNCEDVLKDPTLIETIYGLALYKSNERIISLVNLFVREHKIKINRYNVLNKIYLGVIINNEDKLKELAKRLQTRQDECNYCDFDELKQLQLEYIHKYWKMFEVKNY
jgi:hypothetical protein